MSTDSRAHLLPAGFYGRVSANDTESIENQLAVARERARSEGYDIPDGRDYLFQDVHVSGVTVSRNDFDRMTRMIEDKKAPFTRVYCRASDRFGRWSNPRFYDYFLVRFALQGVDVHFCDVTRNTDFREGVTDQDVGQYISDKVGNVNDAKTRTDLIKKMRRAKRRRALRGFYPGGSTPYGFQRVLVDVNSRRVVRVLEPGERVKMDGCLYGLQPSGGDYGAAIRHIFDGVERGLSLRSIAKELNNLGYPRPSVIHPWYASAVNRIVGNPLYMGMLIWGKNTQKRLVDVVRNPPEYSPDARTPVVVADFLDEPYVTREQFIRVWDILGPNQAIWERRRKSTPKYLFTGKIVCALCGRGYSAFRQGRTGRTVYRHNYGDGDAPRQCPEYARYLRVRDPDEFFLAQVVSVLDDPSLHDRVRAAVELRLGDSGQGSIRTQMDGLEDRIAQAKTRLDELAAERAQLKSDSAKAHSLRLSDGVGTQLDGMEVELEKLRASASAYETQMPSAEVALPSVQQALRDLAARSFAARRAVVEKTVAYIRVVGTTAEIELALHYP